MALIGHGDSLLTFGKLALATAESGTAFGDVLNLGNADLENMSVEFVVKGATGGTSLVFSIEGSDDNSSYTEIAATAAITLANLPKGANLKLPRGFKNKYLRAKVKTVAGTFTAGDVTAMVDTYVGK